VPFDKSQYTNYPWYTGSPRTGYIPRYGMGKLMEGRYLTEPRSYFCRSQKFQSGFSIEDWTLPIFSVATEYYRLSYLYNTYWKWDINPITGARDFQEAAYVRLRDVPADKALALDLIRTNVLFAHTGFKKRPSWNMLFPDGHVVNVPSETLLQQLNTRGGEGSNWSKFDDYLDILNSEAKGENPNDRPLTGRTTHPLPL
jgi:hypothetical protein